VRAGLVVVRNARFGELVASCPGAWRTAPGNREYETFGALVSALADEVLRTQGRVGRRFENPDTGVVLEISAAPSGDRRDVVLLAIDVTAAVRQEREIAALRAAIAELDHVRTLGELVGGVAHDINNALQTVTARLGMLASAPALPPPLQSALELVERAVRDAAQRVQKVHALSRATPAGLGACSLGLVVADAVALARAQLAQDAHRGGAPVNVEVHVPPGLARVAGDETELRHVFLNLLLNARDAMPEGGTVRVSARAAGAWVVLFVQDTGGGIPSEHLGRMFEPYFTTKGAAGTGLGLASAQRVLRALGGHIAAANAPEGGARFTLTFPVADAPAAATVSPTAPPASLPSAATPLGVLVVDDDPDVRDTIAAVVAALGHGVSAVGTALEAVAVLATGIDVGVVFADLHLPDMDGLTLAGRLRALDARLRIYLLTGSPDEVRDDPRRDQATAVVAKPVEVNALAALLGGADAASS
jgi:signal transduction histidine kinase/CheY-like chemotaxis protein